MITLIETVLWKRARILTTMPHLHLDSLHFLLFKHRLEGWLNQLSLLKAFRVGCSHLRTPLCTAVSVCIASPVLLCSSHVRVKLTTGTITQSRLHSRWHTSLSHILRCSSKSCRSIYSRVTLTWNCGCYVTRVQIWQLDLIPLVPVDLDSLWDGIVHSFIARFVLFVVWALDWASCCIDNTFVVHPLSKVTLWGAPWKLGLCVLPWCSVQRLERHVLT